LTGLRTVTARAAPLPPAALALRRRAAGGEVSSLDMAATVAHA
jgi:hypothetical protein